MFETSEWIDNQWIDKQKLNEIRQAAAAVSERVTSVALLYGGTTGEREVSIASGDNVRETLEDEGFTVVPIDTGEPDFLNKLCACEPDVAFIALHGKGGEDGCIQGLLEILNVPYTHSGVKASALAMDKLLTKIIYQASGLDTAGFEVVRKEQFDKKADPAKADPSKADPAKIDSILNSSALPCVVKPLCDGSSLGISIPKTRDELLVAIDEGFKVGDVLLIEEFIAGVEVTIPVLGNDPDHLCALPVIEIVPKNEFYDYESKYTEGGSKHIVPARITAGEMAACQAAALEAHRVLGCAGVSRTDIIVTDDSTPCLIETNTVPGMTRTSLIPDSAKKAGISPGELYRLLIHYALEPQIR
ncbi:MAG: D-alanine--D-alanine ligase [Coriobacteriales bacterium]|jgi:D-alanine-D-alanine ligase|nr:D-alanine--D-alanine ligase [Coriobacteriales bacterium]